MLLDSTFSEAKWRENVSYNIMTDCRHKGLQAVRDNACSSSEVG